MWSTIDRYLKIVPNSKIDRLPSKSRSSESFLPSLLRRWLNWRQFNKKQGKAERRCANSTHICFSLNLSNWHQSSRHLSNKRWGLSASTANWRIRWLLEFRVIFKYWSTMDNLLRQSTLDPTSKWACSYNLIISRENNNYNNDP